MLMEFLPISLVLQRSVCVYEPALIINSPSQLVFEEAIFVPLHVDELGASLDISIKIASNIVSIKVISLQVERRRKFTLLI